MNSYSNLWDTPGSANITLPAGVVNLVITCWAGGGCGARNTRAGYYAGGGGGGCAVANTGVAPRGTVLTVHVGGGGVSGGSLDGGASYVTAHIGSDTPVTVCNAYGGGGVDDDATTGGRGNGGSVGDILNSGGDGYDGDVNQSGGGGGGAGSDNSTGNGAAATSYIGGAGGTGDGGDGADGLNGTEGAGSDGRPYGGGGSGSSAVGAGAYGGSGGDGAVQILYDYADNILLNIITSFGNNITNYILSFYYRSSQQLGVWIKYTTGDDQVISNVVATNTDDAAYITFPISIDNTRVVQGIYFGYSQLGGTLTKWVEIDVVEFKRYGGNTLIPNGDGTGTTDFIDSDSDGLADYWGISSTGAGSSTWDCEVRDAGDGFTDYHQYFSCTQTGEHRDVLLSSFGVV